MKVLTCDGARCASTHRQMCVPISICVVSDPAVKPHLEYLFSKVPLMPNEVWDPSNQSPETKNSPASALLGKWSQEAEMSNQRSETRKGDSQERALGHTDSFCADSGAQASQPFSSLLKSRFPKSNQSNRVTRFILPLGRPWNPVPWACPYCSERMKTLNLGEPVWLHPLPASWLSGYWLTRSLMHPGGILPHSLVALSGWNGPNYLPIHITQTKSLNKGQEPISYNINYKWLVSI